MLWSNVLVLKFVELYRREQLLWDPKHPSHRNRSEVADAWLRIQNELNTHCSVLELKRKKESLMTSFRMHFAKKKQQEGYRTTWFAYTALESFLGGKYECDSTVNQTENESQHGANLLKHLKLHKNEYEEITRLNLESSTETEENPRTITESGSRKRNTTDRIGQHKDSIGETKYSSKKQHFETVPNFKTNERRDMDECDLYAQLLATKLRKLDEHQRDIAMHEIDNIMFRAKMNSSQGRKSSSSPVTVTRKVQSPIFIVTSENQSQYEDENISYQDHTQLQDSS